MLSAVPYAALVALHLLAVGVFLTGLVLGAEQLPRLTAAGQDAEPREVRRLRVLQLAVTTPALVLVWALGIAMALRAGWFAMDWLRIKLLLVAALSVLHGRQLGTLRRLAGRRAVAPVGYRPLILIAVLTVAIGVLVTVKPA